MHELQHTTTRQYLAGTRLASGAASGRTTLPTTFGPTREARLHGTADYRIVFGDSTVTAAVDGNSIPMPANAPEVVIVPANATHFAVIRESADGFVTLNPVA